VEAYWREIADGLAGHGIPVRHVVLHAEPEILRRRIARATSVPSPFRLRYVDDYAQAAETWLHAAADLVVDTSHVPAADVARRVAAAGS
jgi:chloramphenicol 3-O-phosphotransferase